MILGSLKRRGSSFYPRRFKVGRRASPPSPFYSINLKLSDLLSEKEPIFCPHLLAKIAPLSENTCP